VAAYALARILLHVLRPVELPLATLLAWTGAAAIIAGGVLALRQTDARRLLAYSSVSQMGCIALGLGLATPAALAGAYLHILNHALMKAALFLTVGAAALRGRGPQLAALGLGHGMPVTAACAVVAALSMVGVPPAGGFFSKWYLLQGAFEAREPLLVLVILVGSLLALGYMYRFTEAVWFGPSALAERDVGEPRPIVIGLVLLATATVAVGLGSAVLVEILAPVTGSG
jgi:multicomponent Na+:H+ antiporter subunit D